MQVQDQQLILGKSWQKKTLGLFMFIELMSVMSAIVTCSPTRVKLPFMGASSNTRIASPPLFLCLLRELFADIHAQRIENEHWLKALHHFLQNSSSAPFLEYFCQQGLVGVPKVEMEMGQRAIDLSCTELSSNEGLEGSAGFQISVQHLSHQSDCCEKDIFRS